MVDVGKSVVCSTSGSSSPSGTTVCQRKYAAMSHPATAAASATPIPARLAM
jgi:hypothetical protein